jgi:branched-chain amino acid transport system permease protein
MDQAIINGLAEGSVYALLALGLVFINRITEVATFAHGEVAAVSAFVGYTIFQASGVPFVIAVFCSIVAGGVLGFAIERSIIRPVQASGLLATIIVTLGLYFVLHNGIVAIWGPEVRPYPAIFGDATIRFLGLAISAQHLGVIATAFLVALALATYLRFTRSGLALRAIPQNRYGAAVIGLDLRRLVSKAWVIGSAVGAMAGVLIAPLTFLNSNMMIAPMIKAFAVAALGGLDSLVGAFVGGLLLGVVENVTVMFIPTYLKDSIAFFFIFIVLLVQPKGLFGKTRREKV